MATKCRRYKKRVSIEHIASGQTRDAHGHITETATTWEEYTTAFCDVISKGGREFWKVDQVAADVSHVWYCMWNSVMDAATPQMRLVWEGKTYEILAVIDVDLAHREIEIQTRRAV